MYSVLIVEDEMLVSFGLRNMIDWKSLGMQVVADADTAVSPSWHGLAMRARTHQVLASSELSIAYGGGHGADGGYSKDTDMMAFLNDPMGTRAPLSHTHTQAQIGGLSAALASAGGARG